MKAGYADVGVRNSRQSGSVLTPKKCRMQDLSDEITITNLDPRYKNTPEETKQMIAEKETEQANNLVGALFGLSEEGVSEGGNAQTKANQEQFIIPTTIFLIEIQPAFRFSGEPVVVFEE